MFTLKKSYTFDSAHFIPGHEKCGQVHGHTWTISIFIKGLKNETTQMVMDFHLLNSMVRPLVRDLDHTNLNNTISIPTAENIAEYFVAEIKAQITDNSIRVIGCQVQEGDGGSVYYEQKAW